MNVTPTDLPEVLLIEPRVFSDACERFFESWQRDRCMAAGVPENFVQDNISRSVRGTLRGLHSQEPYAQGKLVMVFTGRIFDVAVDVRRGSPRSGKWVGLTLDAKSARQLWILPGFAHGFCVLSETADFVYKCTDFYSPSTERTVRWNDPAIGITWPVDDPILSPKDTASIDLSAAPVLPEYLIPS